MTKKQDLTTEAEAYKSIQLKIKELEKQAAPYKKKLQEWAKKEGITEPFEVGGLSIEPRTSSRAVFAQEKVNPDWLYRAQKDGFKIKFAIEEKSQTEYTAELLAEIDYSEKETTTYAIRI